MWFDDTDSKSIQPSNKSSIRRVEEYIRSALEDEKDLVLEIRFRDENVSLRDLSKYISLIDGAYGRSNLAGFRSYALSPQSHLRVTRIESGSSVFEFALSQVDNIELWRFLVMSMVMITGWTNTSKVVKNYTKSAKNVAETIEIWTKIPRNVSEYNYDRKRKVAVRRLIRSVLKNSGLFCDLSRRDIDSLVILVEEVLIRERENLPGARRFERECVIDVALKIRPSPKMR